MKRIIDYISKSQYLFIVYLVGILYIICPLQIYGYRIQSVFQGLYIIWTLVLIGDNLIKKRYHLDKMFITMICFYIWCWISFIFQPKPHGIIPIKHLFTLLMLMALFFQIGDNQKEENLEEFLITIFKLVIFMVVLLNVLSIGYYYLRGIIQFPDFITRKFDMFLERNGIYRFAGIYFHPVLAGEKCFLAIVFSILLFKKKKNSWFWMLITLISSGIMLLLADSRSTYLQLVIVSVFAAYQLLENIKGKHVARIVLLVFVAFSVMLILYLLSQQGSEMSFQSLNKLSSNRLIIWKTAIGEAMKRPWLGWGWENGDSIVMYTQTGIENCHNIIINLFLWTGIPGVTLFLMMTVIWSVHIIKNWESLKAGDYHWLVIITVTLYVQSLVDILIVGEDIRIGTPFFWLFAGITYYAAQKTRLKAI